MTVSRRPEALALIGLYLRSQNEFITWRGVEGGSSTMNSGLYYWVGVRELLPAAWRWFSACVQKSRAIEDDTLLDLGQSLLRRMQRVLETRDHFHRVFNLPQNNDTAKAALADLDSILVSLMGAVDASARVAHVVLRLSGSIHTAAWQYHKGWLPKVAKSDAALATLFDTGTPLQHTLTILRLLRNTVHGQMMRTIAVQQRSRIRDTVISLPSQDEAEILAAMEALGGGSIWGLSGIVGRQVVDPGLFVEELVPRMLTLLNTVMEHTPVERLGHVRLTPAQYQAPTDERGAFRERNRLSIRWQLGVTEGGASGSGN